MIPDDLRDTLKFGLQFIPTPPQLRDTEVVTTVNRFIRSIKWHRYFQQSDKPYTLSKLRVPSVAMPPPISHVFDLAVSKLESSLLGLFRSPIAHPLSHNLSVAQYRSLKVDSTKFTIKPADKNLGVCVISTPIYNAACHATLSDTKTYRRIVTGHKALPEIFSRLLAEIKNMSFVISITPELITYLNGVDINFVKFLTHHKVAMEKIQKLNLTDGTRLQAICTLLPALYQLPKIHKAVLSWRPIISTIKWICTPMSTLLDVMLQQHLPALPSYIKDTPSMIARLRNTPLPHSSYDNTFLISADVVSLYPSIPIEYAISIIIQYLTVTLKLPEPVCKLIGTLLRHVLRNNYFSFGDTLFHQLDGTAMGTPTAVSFATLFLAILEHPWYQKWIDIIKLFGRFVDDVFLIVTCDHATATNCIADYNTLHPNIQITFNISATSVNFLDLVISKPVKLTHAPAESDFLLVTSLYQKPINIYQYIPPNTAHQPSVLRGFITGELLRIKRYCTLESDIIRCRDLFHKRLIARGYTFKFLDPLFRKSAQKSSNAISESHKTISRGNILVLPTNSTTISQNFKHAVNNSFTTFLAEADTNVNWDPKITFAYTNSKSIYQKVVRTRNEANR